MALKTTVITYSKGLFAIALALATIFFILNFLHTKGPTFVQGPAGTVGSIISGSKYNF